MSITSLEFKNYKALPHFSVRLQHMNLLVGPNNAGKSTILGALKLLSVALRRALAKGAEVVEGPNGRAIGYVVPEGEASVSVENAHTDYADTDTSIRFRCSNGNALVLFFPSAGGCNLLAETDGRPPKMPGEFKRAFPVSISVVPELGPLEHEEEIVEEATVRRNLMTHRASRNFRNYWRYNPGGFDEFAEALRQTWPGMDIEPPRRAESTSSKLVMFGLEERIPRELYWCGFGFQVWCQLLTHVVRTQNSSVLVIDEPETYLHPDLQRQLIVLLRSLGPSIVVATHSSEIMAEADPAEIMLVDKTKRSAARLRDVEAVQNALEAVGSVQNITLTRLARNRRMLFVEGTQDYRRIRSFARKLGLKDLAGGADLTAVEVGGFSAWEKIRASSWALSKTLGTSLRLAAILDRDFRPDEEIERILTDLLQHVEFAHIHGGKELENHLLVPEVLQRVVAKLVRERGAGSAETQAAPNVVDYLKQITQSGKNAWRAQYVDKHRQFFQSSGKDGSTLATEALNIFDRKWRDMSTRLEIVHGKDVLTALRTRLQSDAGITLTDARIIEEFRTSEVPQDLVVLLHGLDAFRRGEAPEVVAV